MSTLRSSLDEMAGVSSGELTTEGLRAEAPELLGAPYQPQGRRNT